MIGIKKQAELQKQFVALAQAVAVCGTDAATITKLESIRAELQLVERDLAMAQSDSAA